MLIGQAFFPPQSIHSMWLLICDGPLAARPGGSASLYSAGTPWFSQDRQTNRDKSPQELMWLFPCHELVPRMNLPSRGWSADQSYGYSPPLSFRWTLQRNTTCFCVQTEPRNNEGSLDCKQANQLHTPPVFSTYDPVFHPHSSITGS